MKKGIAKRAVALILAVGLFAALCACGKDKDAQVTKVKPEHVYGSTYVSMPEGMDYVNQLTASDDKIYFTGYFYEDNTSKSVLSSMNFDGTDIQTVLEYVDENDMDKGIYNSTNIQNILVDPNGGLWVLMNTYHEDNSDPENYIWENKMSLRKVSDDGTELASIDLDSLKGDSEDNYFYINSIQMDSQGNIILNCGQKLVVLDKDGNKLFELEEQNYIENVIVTGESQILVFCWGDTGLECKTLDMAKRGWGEKIEFSQSNAYNMMAGKDSDLLINNSNALYAYDLETQEMTEKCNWINSDINYNQLQNLTALPDGRLIAMEYDDLDNKNKILILTEKDPSEIVEKVIINMATLYLNYDVRRAVIKFNKASEEYRVQVTEYNVYNTNDDYEAGLNKLNYEIISGNIPDIMDLNQLPYETYASKGILADLYEFMDKDESFDRSQYMENIFEALEFNDKLYELVPCINAYTVVGKTSLVGSEPGWTMDELDALLKTLPEGTSSFENATRNDILQMSFFMAMDQFVDRGTGACNFTSEGFVNLLEFAKTFPEEIDYDALYGEGSDYWTKYESMYKENRTVLMIQYLYNFEQMKSIKDQFGEAVTFKGFPTENKNGSALIPSMELAISAKSPVKDACWEFIKYFLTDEYQDFLIDNYSGFPVKIKQLDTMAEKAMKQPDEDTEVIGGSTTVYSNGAIASARPYDPYNTPLTQDEVDQIMNLLKSLTQVMRYDQSMLAIIQEEAGAYFAGQKSATDTATIIQSRVQIYINESR